jgi:hypothetical protein
MSLMLRSFAIAAVAALSSVVPISGSAPNRPTLLFDNDGTRTLDIFVDGIYVGTVGMASEECLSMPFRPGLATLEATTPDRQVVYYSPPTALDESNGWYWRIGTTPEMDAKLTLQPAQTCPVK